MSFRGITYPFLAVLATCHAALAVNDFGALFRCFGPLARIASISGSPEPADIPIYLSTGTSRRIAGQDTLGYYLFAVKQDGNGVAHFIPEPPKQDNNGYFNINVRVLSRSGTTPLQIDRFSQYPLHEPKPGVAYSEMDFRSQETHLTDAETHSAMKEDLLRRFDETARRLELSSGWNLSADDVLTCRQTLDQLAANCLPDDGSKQMTTLRTEQVRFGGQPTTLASALEGFLARGRRAVPQSSARGASGAKTHATTNKSE